MSRRSANKDSPSASAAATKPSGNSTLPNTDPSAQEQRKRYTLKEAIQFKGNEAQMAIPMGPKSGKALTTKSFTIFTCAAIVGLFFGVVALVALLRTGKLSKGISLHEECNRIAETLIKQLNTHNSCVTVSRSYGTLQIETIEAKVMVELSTETINAYQNGTLFAKLRVKTFSAIITFSSLDKRMRGKIECVFSDYEIHAAFTPDKRNHRIDGIVANIIQYGNTTIDKVSGIDEAAPDEKIKFVANLNRGGINDVEKIIVDQMHRIFANFFTATQPDDVIFSFCFGHRSK